MIILKDICTDDEILTDAYRIETEDDEFLIKCEGKMIQQKIGGGISADLIGGNASQEECGDEQADDSEQVQSGIDIILHHNLKDCSDFFINKKALVSYIKKWVKNAVAAIKTKDECKSEEFKKICTEKMKGFLSKFTDDATVYTAGEFDPETAQSCPLIGVWSTDGMGLTLYAIKGALYEEKQ